MSDLLANIAVQPTRPQAPPLDFRAKSRGVIPRGLTLLAVIIILFILAVVIGNILIGGVGTISWEFLTDPPEEGM